jgi:hypothetical protein
MSKIPAIVLSYDANLSYVLHLVMAYQRLWRDHPFHFIVPCQDPSAGSALAARFDCSIIQSPPSIRDTVLTLLAPFSDEQWVYWCIDDKYPVHLDVVTISNIADLISSDRLVGVDGICFCRTRKLRNGKALMRNKLGLWHASTKTLVGTLFRRRNYSQIWLHQFLRVGVLRHLFKCFPQCLSAAKELDALKDAVPLPDAHRIFVTRGHHASFGESTSRGVITKNCALSMVREGLLSPRSGMGGDQEIFIGFQEKPLKPLILLNDFLSEASSSIFPRRI